MPLLIFTNLRLSNPGLCITIAANIADSGILSFDACFPDSIVGFVPAKLFNNARYFEYFMRTIKGDLLKFAPATAQKNINLSILNSVLIPLPPLNEQIRIVAKVDELMALCDQLETQLSTSQLDRARLLEATLSEALGARNMPSPVLSRPSLPAAPPPRATAAPLRTNPEPIKKYTSPTIQGSLLEMPRPTSQKPAKDAQESILAHMQPNKEYSRAQLCDALGLSVYEWNMAIRELKESGRVVQTGEKRGAKYSLSFGRS